jgi:hypothetical protein
MISDHASRQFFLQFTTTDPRNTAAGGNGVLDLIPLASSFCLLLACGPHLFFISLFHVRSCLDDSVTDGCITLTLPGEDGAGNYGHTRRLLFSSVHRLHFFLKTSDSRYPFLFSPQLPHERRFPAVSSSFVLLFLVFYTRQRFFIFCQERERESYHAHNVFCFIFVPPHAPPLITASARPRLEKNTHRLARAKKEGQLRCSNPVLLLLLFNFHPGSGSSLLDRSHACAAVDSRSD